MVGPPVQLAYLVDDPDTAARRWEQEFGAGPFEIHHHIAVDDVVIDETPGTFDHSSAYGWWGTTMVELVCIHDPTSPLSRSSGLHHVACFVDNLDRALADSAEVGMPLAMTARAGQTRFAFVDDLASRGHYWELYEPSERLLAFYSAVEQRHREART